jgi:hypothetical protein
MCKVKLKAKPRKRLVLPLLHCGCVVGGGWSLLCANPYLHHLRFRSHGSTDLYAGLFQLSYLGAKDEKPDRTFQESLV